jgi:hypothetical protein
MTKPVDIGGLQLRFREAMWNEVLKASTPNCTDEEIKFALQLAYRHTRKRLNASIWRDKQTDK